MARRVGVFGAERWPKRVNFGQSERERFRFKLAAHSQKSRARKEILREIDVTVFSRWIFDVDRRNAKQFSCSFAIAAGDDRCVNVNETALLEKLVNGECQPTAHAKNAAEKI